MTTTYYLGKAFWCVAKIYINVYLYIGIDICIKFPIKQSCIHLCKGYRVNRYSSGKTKYQQ